MERINVVSKEFILRPKGVIKFVFVAAAGALLTMAVAQFHAYAVSNEAGTKTVVIPVEGMTCSSCVAQVKRALKAVDGVVEVNVSLEQRSARVRYIEGRVTPERLVEAISKSGYKAGTPKAGGAP